jgi:monoamine oxidase
MKSLVVIIGGGLAGLTAARHFHQAGIDFQLLEARDRLGGRILSVDASGQISDDGFDLGPSWFWPGMHSAMSYLADNLGLPFFAQHSDCDRVFQRLHDEAPLRSPGIRQEPESMRLIRGVGRVISTLASGNPHPAWCASDGRHP